MEMAERTYILSPIGIIHSDLMNREAAPRQGYEGSPEAWVEIYSDVADGLLGNHMATSVITWPPEASALCANCHNQSGGPAAQYLDAPERAGDVIAAFSRADEVIDWTHSLIAEERKRLKE